MSSLKTRIIISMVFIILLVTIGSYLVIEDIQKGIIEGEFRDKGFFLSNHLARELTEPLLLNDLVEINNYIDNLKNEDSEIEYIFVTDSEGIVLVHTFDNGFPKALVERSKPSNVNKEFILNTEIGIIHEFDTPLYKEVGYVHIGLSENQVRARIELASHSILFLTISAIFIGTIFSVVIGRRLTDPIQELTDGANRINQGILDQEIDVDTGDELGELAITFNKMSANLDQKIKDLVSSKERTENAEKYLETLFNSIEDGIIVLNVNHEVTKVNESFLKLTGSSEAQVLGKTCHEIIFGSKYQHNSKKCNIDKLLQTKKPVRFEHETLIGDTTKILDVNGSLFIDSTGTVNVILVIRDVTQQKQLENEIITRNRELTVLNSISRNISETFELDNILVNSLVSLLDLTGMECVDAYIQDEATGDFVPEIHTGYNCKTIPANAFKHLINKNDAVVFENSSGMPESITSGYGNGISSFVAFPLSTKEKHLGMITLMSRKPRTFTEKDKELFKAIGNQIGVAIESTRFYNNIIYLKEFNEEIIDNVNLGIHVVDKNMKVLAVNDEMVALGRGRITREKMVDNNLYDVFPFLKEKNIDKEYEHVIKTGKLFQSEEKTVNFGEEIFTSTSKIPLKDKDGNVEKIITVIKDVTSQKKLEEELKDSYDELKLAYSKLKELFKVKDNFLSNISHELSTPLTSIMGFTELLIDEEVTDEQYHKLEIILRNSKRLSRLIKSLLDTTLIDSNNFELQWETLAIYDVVTEAADDFKKRSEIKKVPINIDVPHFLVVDGDRERLLQLFSNILDNAFKFTMTGEINVTGDEDDENIHITISDTGIGIPEDKLELVFDRFYQLEAMGLRKHGGTGLGLWVSRNIVNAHGGKIWAESRNRGSTFHILLPKNKVK